MDPKVFEAKRDKIISFLEDLGLDNASTMSNSELQLAVVRLPRTNSSNSSNASTTESDSSAPSSSEACEPSPSVKPSKKSTTWKGMKSRAFVGSRIGKAVTITNAAHNNNGAEAGPSFIEEDDAFQGAIIDDSANIMNNSYNNNKNYNPPPHTMPQGMPHFQPWGFQPPPFHDPSQFPGAQPQYQQYNSGYNSGYYPGAPAYGSITEVRTYSLSKALAKKLPWKK